MGEFDMTVRTLWICTWTELPSAGALRQRGRNTVKQLLRGLRWIHELFVLLAVKNV